MVGCCGLGLGQGSQSHHVFDLWLSGGEGVRDPIQITEGGAVGSQDFSPDSVGWGTSEVAVGHPLRTVGIWGSGMLNMEHIFGP